MNSVLVFTFLVIITVLLNTVAQILLKLGATQNNINIYLAGGIAAYGISTIFYILFLSKTNLSVAYPIVIGLTIFSTTLSGAIIFRENASALHWLGIGLILSGISAIAIAKPG
jgi:multidrug transporter EmrE-like cation transporter